MVGCYTSFKKKENISSRNCKMKVISDYNLKNNYDYKLYFDIVKNNVDVQSRVALKNLKESIKKGSIKKVVVPSISNISRRTVDIINFLKFLEKYNCEFESIKEGKICLKDLNNLFPEYSEINVKEEYTR